MNDGQSELFELGQKTEPSGPVECFGMTFESDEAHRTYFLEKLKEKLVNEGVKDSVVIANTFALPGCTPEKTIHLDDRYRSPVYLYRL